MIKKLVPIIKNWLPLAFAITIICALSYATIQQTLRQNANDPQIQMVEDIIDALNSGLSPQNLNSPVRLDIAKTLSPFMVVYSASGTPMVSSGYLNDQIPTLPIGVLEYTKTRGQHRLTWSPRPDVRLAAVIQAYEVPVSAENSTIQNGFVVAARSLREIDANLIRLGYLILIGWLIALLGSLLIMILFNWQSIKPHRASDSDELSELT